MTDDGRFPVAAAGGVPVVATPEELDLTSAPHLEPALAEASAEGHGTFVVDMSRTRFCDSAGLHLLIAAHKQARADGGGLVLAVSGRAVLRLLEITGADRVLLCFASLEEALAHASRDGTGGARTGGRGPAEIGTFASAPAEPGRRVMKREADSSADR